MKKTLQSITFVCGMSANKRDKIMRGRTKLEIVSGQTGKHSYQLMDQTTHAATGQCLQF
jgi:hypothetical protein